jgi:hypothetical protein
VNNSPDTPSGVQVSARDDRACVSKVPAAPRATRHTRSNPCNFQRPFHVNQITTPVRKQYVPVPAANTCAVTLPSPTRAHVRGLVSPQVSTPVQALAPARSASPVQPSTAVTSQTTTTSLSEESEPVQTPVDPFPWRIVKKRKGRKAEPNQIPPPPLLPVIRKQLKKATAAQKPVPSSTTIPVPTQQHSASQGRASTSISGLTSSCKSTAAPATAS